MTGENGINAHDLKRSGFGKTAMTLYMHRSETPETHGLGGRKIVVPISSACCAKMNVAIAPAENWTRVLATPTLVAATFLDIGGLAKN